MMTVDDRSGTETVFDREFRLDELFNAADFRSLIVPLCEGSGIRAALYDAGGICRGGDWSDPGLDAAMGRHSASRAEAFARVTVGEKTVGVWPILVELEPVGYLVISPVGTGETGDIERWAAILMQILDRLVADRYRTLMATGIHAEVVESAYSELQAKHMALECSEVRYRQLAENLELEVRRQTEAIRLAQTRLIHQEKMAAVGQLAAGMAHEINNPMGFITSNLNTLQRYHIDLARLLGAYETLTLAVESRASAAIPQAVKAKAVAAEIDIHFLMKDASDLLSESLSGAQRIADIVRDLKDFARPGEEKWSTVDIAQLLRTTLRMMALEMPAAVRVETDLPLLPGIRCLPRQVNLVFANILRNAIQSIAGEGVIRIRARQAESGVTVIIADTGSGMADAVREKIFEPFFTTRPVGQGKGLGMHTAWRIVEVHGGRLECASRPGTGTAVKVWLPLEPITPITESEVS